MVYDSINLTYHGDFKGPGKEFKVSLSRGINKSEVVCVGSFNSTQLPFEDNNCSVSPTASHVTFYLWGLNENNTDIYFFQKEVMYPPPYTNEWDNGIIVHVKEPAWSIPEKKVNVHFSLSLLITLCGFIVYSFIITTAFIYIVRKGKRTKIQQSEYINVVTRRPKPPKSFASYAGTPANFNSR
ncbi:T-cell-specific surface glycoprotein CD28 isoform X2 [Hyperolius riggenbachi]